MRLPSEMVARRPFHYGAIDPLAIGLQYCLGYCLIVRPLMNSHPRRVIVKFCHTSEIRDREGQNFGWFIEVLRVCFSTMDELIELFYSPKFWVYFSRVIVGELMVITYHLYTPFAHMRVFCCFFHTT